ncbi:hypothetical protein BU17DRAFT_66046 [Hysterangium stoloniferum]|nr:hypothetical protein BU17DRAFT_66046 [Hysterangium stoloniferum]
MNWSPLSAHIEIQKPHGPLHATVQPQEVFHDYEEMIRGINRHGVYAFRKPTMNAAPKTECQSQPVAGGSTTEIQGSRSGAGVNRRSSSRSKGGHTTRGRKTVKAPGTGEAVATPKDCLVVGQGTLITSREKYERSNVPALTFKCEYCGSRFSRNSAKNRHIKDEHSLKQPQGSAATTSKDYPVVGQGTLITSREKDPRSEAPAVMFIYEYSHSSFDEESKVKQPRRKCRGTAENGT